MRRGEGARSAGGLVMRGGVPRTGLRGLGEGESEARQGKVCPVEGWSRREGICCI